MAPGLEWEGIAPIDYWDCGYGLLGSILRARPMSRSRPTPARSACSSRPTKVPSAAPRASQIACSLFVGSMAQILAGVLKWLRVTAIFLQHAMVTLALKRLQVTGCV